MTASFQKKLNEEGLSEVRIENFYDKATDIEKRYLEHLTSLGSCADMIKTHALINQENENRCHLQMDSNTKIHDYSGMYNVTFGADLQRDSMALNASYYDMDYVSAHNKIVYTVPRSKFISTLRRVHLAFCEEHKNDHLYPDKKIEKSKKNSIYAKDFVVALAELGLTLPVIFEDKATKPRTIYAAVMERTEYRITKYIVTAVSRSWGEEEESSYIQYIKSLPSVQVGDATCDYASFCTAVKKHVGILNMHKYGGNFQAWEYDRKNNPTQFQDDTVAHELLLKISNTTVDKSIITRFYDSAVKGIVFKVKDTMQQKLLMEKITDNFLETPERGDALVRELFNCTVRELKEAPFQYSRQFRIESLRSYYQLETMRLKEQHHYLETLLRKSVSASKHYHLTKEREEIEVRINKQSILYNLHQHDHLSDRQVEDKYTIYQKQAEGIIPCINRNQAKIEKTKLEK